jgi:hypothetical protein
MKLKHCIFFLLIILTAGCEPDRSDDPIPYVPFSDIIINLTLPQYNALYADGGHVSIPGGVRGIIIYRLNSSAYLAYERNCSFHPNDACATVDIDASGFYMIDPCCGSTFSFSTGMPTGGVAWRPLRQYATSLNLNELTITDEVVQ